MRQLDLNLLHSFVTIADSSSLTQAAQRLHKTQAAISIQLKKLEELTGKRLMERGYQQPVPTADGELLLQYARRLLSLSEEAYSALHTEEVSGRVRFGIPDDYAGRYLGPALQQFVERYPKVRVEIRNGISQQLLAGLERGELDLALVTRRSSETGGGEVLRRDPLVWVADKEYQLDQSSALPLALYPHGCGFRGTILDTLSRNQRDYYVAFECTGVTGVRTAVDSGLAIAATCPQLVEKNWQVIAPCAQLPALDAIVTELRSDKGEPSKAVLSFAEIIRQQVC